MSNIVRDAVLDSMRRRVDLAEGENASLLSALKAVYDWADDREDITETGHANDAMTVKGMIHDLMGDDFIYANWKPNALKPAGGAQ